MTTKKLSSFTALTVLLMAAASAFGAEVTPRIVGGTIAPNHAYPFVVAIERNSDNFQFCGGTLLSPTRVLTAGHCLATGVPIHIRIGTNNRTIDPGQLINVSARIRHPKYNGSTFDYDVAIFTLASAVALNDSKNLVLLPEACAGLECITGLAKPGTLVRTIGWGATQGDGSVPSLDLRQVDVPVVRNSVCNTAVGGGVSARMICAGFVAGGKDSCSGDSGGPLFGYLPGGRTGVQNGIVSWGVGNCADPNLYGVYTRISNPEIRSFIRQNSGK